MKPAELISLVVFCGLVALASRVGIDLVLGIVSVAAILAAFELASFSRKDGTGVLGVLAAASAAAFPIAVRFRGEDGLIEVGAILVVLSGGIYVSKGLHARVSADFGVTFMISLLTGGLISYLVLLAARPDGGRLVAILGVLVSVDRSVAVLMDRSGQRIWGHVAGALAAMLAAAGLAVALGPGLAMAEMVILAAIVSGASSLSVISGRMIRTRSVPDASIGLVFPAIEALLLAAPAYFYGVKLYLS